jgi:allantoicase
MQITKCKERVFLIFAALSFASIAQADTLYTYTGNQFNPVLSDPVYTDGFTGMTPCACSITGSFTVAGGPLPLDTYVVTPLSFSFQFDGHVFDMSNTARFSTITVGLNPDGSAR